MPLILPRACPNFFYGLHRGLVEEQSWGSLEIAPRLGETGHSTAEFLPTIIRAREPGGRRTFLIFLIFTSVCLRGSAAGRERTDVVE